MSGCEAGAPPLWTLHEIIVGGHCRMTRIALLDEKHSFQWPLLLGELAQGLDLVRGVLFLHTARLPRPTMNNQKEQQLNGAMTHLLELLLLDRAWNGAADGAAFQNLKVRH
jgi:hypothetical protein